MIPCSLGTRRLATMSTPLARSPIVWTYLPQQLPYHLGLLLQETLVANRLSAKALLAAPLDSFSPSKIASLQRTADTDILLLLQHTPVYTAGRREKDPEVAKLEAERLGALGADYVSTMRGGQTTYHGPGQLVGYSIFDMGAANVSFLYSFDCLCLLRDVAERARASTFSFRQDATLTTWRPSSLLSQPPSA